MALVVVSCGGDWDALRTEVLSTSTSSAATTTTAAATSTTTIVRTTSTSSTTTASVARTTSTTTTTTAPTTSTGYSEEELDFFGEVAFGAEYGSDTGRVTKWTHDVHIAVHGEPTAEDLATLEAVVSDLGAIIDTIEIEIVDSGQDVDLHFAPESEFDSIEPNYVPGNLGFFWVWWDGERNITRASVLISTTGVTQAERNHLIREEITQSMGLMRDSSSYPDSIFHSAWTQVQEYSQLDEAAIELLYLPVVAPGMTYSEAVEAIQG